MQTREVYIETNKSLSDIGTAKIDINTAKPISFFELKFGATKGSDENASDKIQDYISKIELIDGADVLWSLSMVEAVALNCFETRARPACDLDLGASGTPEETCFIHFGFFKNDPTHYLPVDQFANLQLKITTNCTAANATYVTNTFTVSVIAHVLEVGFGGYDGFLTSKEHYSWLSTLGGITTVDLPRDYPYRFLMVKALETLLAPEADISNLRLSCDADSYIVFDRPCDDLRDRNLSDFGTFREVLKSNAQDNDVMLSTFFNILQASVTGGTDLYAYGITAFTAERIAVVTAGQD